MRMSLPQLHLLRTSGLPSIINGGRSFSAWTLDDATPYREFAKPVERA